MAEKGWYKAGINWSFPVMVFLTFFFKPHRNHPFFNRGRWSTSSCAKYTKHLFIMPQGNARKKTLGFLKVVPLGVLLIMVHLGITSVNPVGYNDVPDVPQLCVTLLEFTDWHWLTYPPHFQNPWMFGVGSRVSCHLFDVCTYIYIYDWVVVFYRF